MDRNLARSQVGFVTQSRQEKLRSSLPLIVFKIGTLNLALRVESVYKVVEYKPIDGSDLNPFGVTTIGERQVTIVDLYRRFFRLDQNSEYFPGEYLVIVCNTGGELYGIIVNDTPKFLEVPLSSIRVLPESYRRANTLGVASHVAIIPQQAEKLTVFVLNLDLLLPI